MTDPRFGLAGLQGGDYYTPLNAGRGYYYGDQDVRDPRDCPMVRQHAWWPSDLTRVPATAREQPGRWWLIGNEPNNAALQAGDAQTPEQYAAFLWQMDQLIHSNDPSAKLVGPQILNWERADGFGVCGPAPGRRWAYEFLGHYRRTYGSDPPLDAWSLHTYGLTARPTQDWWGDIADIMGCREWLNGNGLGYLPIWVTEFGAVNATNAAGQYDHTALAQYADILFPWMMSRGVWDYGLQSWFLFEAGEEPPSPTSFALYADGQVSILGRRFADYAHILNIPRPAISLATVETGRYALRCTVSTSGGPMNTIDRVHFQAPPNVQIEAPGMPLSTDGSFDFGQLGSVHARPSSFTFYAAGDYRWTLPFEVRDAVGPWSTLIAPRA